jgi:muramoyltetrapeptide carboxypeptidase
MNNMSKPLQGVGVLPPFLKPGSVVGITCPSGYVARERVTYAIEVLNRWGFGVNEGKTIGSGQFYFAGTDEERRADLQSMLDDPELDAIIMGRGGYGMSRIIDDLDFTAFVKKPKWICGFSDITVLHSHLHARYGIASLHSPMCGAFKPETENETYLKTFYSALTGGALNYITAPAAYNIKGTAEGVLTGGCLSLLAHLLDSVSDIDTTDKILFIEDIGEHLYKVDRMLVSLKRAGKLDKLKALIVGQFTDMLDTERPFGQTIQEIVLDKVKEYDYPVLFDFPSGHEDINYTLTLGATHKLSVTAEGGILELQR